MCAQWASGRAGGRGKRSWKGGGECRNSAQSLEVSSSPVPCTITPPIAHGAFYDLTMQLHRWEEGADRCTLTHVHPRWQKYTVEKRWPKSRGLYHFPRCSALRSGRGCVGSRSPTCASAALLPLPLFGTSATPAAARFRAVSNLHNLVIQRHVLSGTINISTSHGVIS